MRVQKTNLDYFSMKKPARKVTPDYRFLYRLGEFSCLCTVIGGSYSNQLLLISLHNLYYRYL